MSINLRIYNRCIISLNRHRTYLVNTNFGKFCYKLVAMNSKGKKRLIDGNNSSKRKFLKDECCVNDFYFQSDFIAEFSEAIVQKKNTNFGKGIQFFAEPFPCAVLPNFIKSDEFIESLKRELNELDMHTGSSDLFQFKHSDDLARSSLPAIKKLSKIFYEDCLPWMEKIMNVSLTSVIDMTCSVYDYTDVLLCHDDMLKERHIAYIYYLVPDWEENDGGMLDIFHSKKGSVTKLARSLMPVANNFVFFEVSPASFHQVSEVLTDKRRLSVNGWFHGPCNKAQITPEKQDAILLTPQPLQNENITDWINPMYFSMDTIIQIRSTFVEMSEIELQDFLVKEKYIEVAEALKSCSIKWKIVGPRNKKHFQEGECLPPIIQQCMHILHSEEMCLILSNLTGLALHPQAEVELSSSEESDSESDATTSANVSNHEVSKKKSQKECMKHQIAKYSSVTRKWSHGHYTLLHDKLMEGRAKLESILYFNCDDWDSECGGFTSYVAKGEEDELLRIEPKSNSLALAYSDEKTAGFVKYINSRVQSRGDSVVFHDIYTSYYEQTEE